MQSRELYQKKLHTFILHIVNEKNRRFRLENLFSRNVPINFNIVHVSELGLMQ